MKAWGEEAADSDDRFTFRPGERYAVLASASKNYSVSEIGHYLAGKGFDLTYSWEEGEPTRGKFTIDQWLASVPPDTRSNHRWVYGEGNFEPGRDPWTIGRDAPWPFTVYHVAHVMRAVDAPDVAALPSTAADAPKAAPRSGPGLGTAAAVVAGIGGLLIARGRRGR
jgi:hypothetical protein